MSRVDDTTQNPTGTAVAQVTQLREDLAAHPPGPERTSRLTAWFATHGPRVLDAIDPEVSDPAHTTATATALWELIGEAGPGVQEPFCSRLRGLGAHLQQHTRPTGELAALFRHSTTVAITRATYTIAEVEAMRELKVHADLGDRAGEVGALQRLSRIFRAQDRLHRVMDTYDEIMAMHQLTGDTAEMAQALRMIAQVLIEANRPVSALPHLLRARKLLDTAGPSSPRRAADLLVLTGKARWDTGSPILARKHFQRAAQLLDDAGDPAAAAVEALLSARVRDTPAPPLGELLWLGAEPLHLLDAALYPAPGRSHRTATPP